MKPAMITDVVASSAAGLALHAATLNMLVKSGVFTQAQADEAFENAIRSIERAAEKSPEHAETFAMARSLVKTMVDDGDALTIINRAAT